MKVLICNEFFKRKEQNWEDSEKFYPLGYKHRLPVIPSLPIIYNILNTEDGVIISLKRHNSLRVLHLELVCSVASNLQAA